MLYKPRVQEEGLMLKKSLCALCFIIPMLSSFSDAGWEGKVIGVRDGETIIVFDGKNPPVPVRLNDVAGAGADVSAKEFVSGTVFGKRVRVENEKRGDDGAVVAEIIMPGGTSLNEILRRRDARLEIGRDKSVSATKPSGASPARNPVQTPAAFSSSSKKYSSPAAQQFTEPPPVSGVRTWRDREGNVHFSGTVGEKD